MRDVVKQEISWKQLRRANRATPVPFLLPLNGNEFPFECEEVVRIIPGKRLVLFGIWNEQHVVAKLFFEPRNAKRHFERELEGVEILMASGVPTPKLLFSGSALKNHVQVLIFERIMDAQNLEDIWQDKTSPQELELLMEAVILELATQHVLGIVQHDLHFKNLLIKNNQIYTLDGGSIECIIHEPLSKPDSLDHLGLFFTQLGVGTEELQGHLFEIYAKSRGWLVKKADIKLLKNAIKKWTAQRWKNYERKIVRNCTAFKRVSKATALIMYAQEYTSPDFLNVLANPEAVFSDPKTEVLKSGRTTTVVKYMVDGKTLVIKRYNIKDAWHWARRSLRQTRAARSWRLANLLRLFGVPTAKPVAFIEKRFLGLRNKSYFIMEYVPGADIGEYFSSYREDDAHFEKIASRVAILLKNLAKLRMSHGDLKTTNILIENDRPLLIDLDGMSEHKRKGEVKRAYQAEIKRFMKNWTSYPSLQALFGRLLQD